MTALEMKRESIPIRRGHGQDYININKIYNQEQTGYAQWIRHLEDEILETTDEATTVWGKKAPSGKQIKELYRKIDELLISRYLEYGYHLMD